jgi:hypothetical protein
MKTYTVIRPDEFDDYQMEYRWHGGVTVSAWQGEYEVEGFSIEGDGPLTLSDVVEACERNWAAFLAEMEGDED